MLFACCPFVIGFQKEIPFFSFYLLFFLRPDLAFFLKVNILKAGS
ncbi:hypothetical protein M107_3427 [Bacteroides fragilis str. 3725 D9(v)]|nr:hypothetical protein M107_3427 [Bacteroides fragilis str. 3725 D9(v)]EYA60520.1 hypothetical protein M070_3170 [Bacteroides fragilis str. A7 (UDC12-2)]EYA95081.1 hypothetical protein M141_3188 [Bacteroides fragilis str. S38L5]EYB13392.1 hypothetical protein M140_3136 [Bacteroides fragilis str. S38L3]